MTPSTEIKPNLTSGRLLARNTIWNLLGLISPLAVGLVAVPTLIRVMGVTRFGVLSLAWVVIGYFSLFDLGIGRAVTKLIADKLAAHEEQSIPPLVWTCLLLMLVLGSIGGLVLASITPWLVDRILKVPSDLAFETRWAFWLLAISIPTVTVTSGLRGILEAQQRFGLLNLIRIPMSVFSFVGPLLVLPFSHSLVPVMSVLVLGRIIGMIAHLFACFHSMPAIRQHFCLDRAVVAPMAKFGGWLTVSNVVGPIMVYMDRFLVGALLSVGAIAYYSAPFDMVSRLWIISGAMVSVLFPAFAVTLLQDPSRTGLLLVRGSKYIFLTIFPIVLVITTLAPEGLRLWLGEGFAQNSTTVLRLLAAGVFVNCLAQVPFVLIQSAGRADITAKLHVAELPLYVLAVWLLTKRMGIEGTAIAWAGRSIVDALLVCWLAHRFLPAKTRFLSVVTIGSASGLLLLYLSTLVHPLVLKLEFLAVALLGFVLIVWLLMLDPQERALVSSKLGR